MKVLKIILAAAGALIILDLAVTGISVFQKGGKYDGRTMENILGVPPEKATLDDIKKLGKADCVQLFYAAPAPSIEDLNGEYSGVVLNVGIMGLTVEFFIHNLFGPGHWEGKAFSPSDKIRGSGYNLFTDSDGTVRRTRRMDTEIGPSVYDGKPSLKINYGPYNSGLVGTQRDDLRKVNDTLFIGLGHNTLGGGSVNPGPFVIYGAAKSWTGPDKE